MPMRLKDLIKGFYTKELPAPYADYQVALVSCDSREAQMGGLFVALPGFKFDGNDFIKDAVAQGAHVIVKKGPARDLGNYTIPESVCVLDVDDPKAFLRDAALRFYQNPSTKVRTIGVTGTNGKTTITYLLESIIHAASKQTGVIGTVNYRVGHQIIPSTNTTPGFIDNQRFLFQLAEQKVAYCVMETSSHALAQGRLDGIGFVGGVFTNLTQDHLDYHRDMETYFQAKALLFSGLGPEAVAVINADDAYGCRLIGLTKAKVLTYGIDTAADVRAVDIHYALSGTAMGIVYPNGRITLNTRLIGKHNVYNLLAAFAQGLAEGFSPLVIAAGLEAMRHVPGRLEAIDGPQDYFIFIDYAHTEDGLVNVLNGLRAVSRNRIIVVFGCGGDRDRTKRPKMGRAVCQLADYAIVTSDNPRSEDPQAIIDEVLGGFTRNNYEACVDRREAIGRALKMAQRDDIVLLAGKGHENYQVLKEGQIPFNERAIVEAYLKG